jgi:hypothetical protein
MACKVTLGELVFSGEKKHKIPEGMNLIGETLTVSGVVHLMLSRWNY